MIFAAVVSDLDSIASAIKGGDSKELATYFDNTVEVKIANKEGAYSKSQAEAIVKDFLQKIRLKPSILSTTDLPEETMHITPSVH